MGETSIEKQRIESVKAQVLTSDLRQSHKDDIGDLLLNAGNATNGVADKTQAITIAIASLAICFARDAMYRREDFKDLIKSALSDHMNSCPLTKPDGNTTTFNLPGYAKVSGPRSVIGILSICITICWVGFLVAKGTKIL
jgi:hypothetical protein